MATSIRSGDLKIDIINRAYEELRISGLTKVPTPRDLTKALDTLENMASEYKKRGICTDYNFEDEPDSNSLHNLQREYWDAYSLCLARRLISTFGKGANDKIDPELLKRQRAAFSFLSSATAVVRQVLAPTRMPLGSGNTTRGWNRWRKFNYPTQRVPNDCYSNSMVYDEVDNYTEHFDAYLDDGETISSYTITADDGLTINSSSNTNTDVIYQIQADDSNTTVTTSLLQVVITVTTSASRVKVRTIDFELVSE